MLFRHCAYLLNLVWKFASVVLPAAPLLRFVRSYVFRSVFLSFHCVASDMTQQLQTFPELVLEEVAFGLLPDTCALRIFTELCRQFLRPGRKALFYQCRSLLDHRESSISHFLTVLSGDNNIASSIVYLDLEIRHIEEARAFPVALKDINSLVGKLRHLRGLSLTGLCWCSSGDEAVVPLVRKHLHSLS